MSAWKPHIYRAWNQRTGEFYWKVTPPKANAWTGMTLSSARTLEREAHWFAGTLNARGRGRPAPRPRCPLCEYQHGHQIGCANNPVDIALRASPLQG